MQLSIQRCLYVVVIDLTVAEENMLDAEIKWAGRTATTRLRGSREVGSAILGD